MKVLIVSFDKTLTENLKQAFSDHEVYVAKNSEEAIKMIPSDVEGVIYDAISGAISEEDINTLYTKKFSNAKYLILYDELFPVDEKNIIVSKKMLVPRDTEPKEIVEKLVGFTPETTQKTEETKYELEQVPLEVSEEVTQSVEETIQELERAELGMKKEETEEPSEEIPKKAGGEKILIVSFDQTLIDSLKASLGQRYDVLNVRTVKQAIEQGKDADLIIFDAISGVIAEKGLIEMSNDPDLSRKAYVILVDDLFPINVESIPLEHKLSISRDTDPSRLKEIIEEELEKHVPEKSEEKAEEEAHKEEVVEEAPQELELEKELPQEIPEIEIERTVPEIKPEEEEIPPLETLESIIEEKTKEEVKEEAPQTQEVQPTISLSDIDIEKTISDAVTRALSEEKVREAVMKALESAMGDLEKVISDVVKREIERVFEELDVKDLIKQSTYQVLKEKLEELIS